MTHLCPNLDCLQPFSSLSTTRPDETPTQDSIILCGYCGQLACIELITKADAQIPTIRLLTEDEFVSLSKPERTDLTFAIRNIQAYHSRLFSKPLTLPPWYEQNN